MARQNPQRDNSQRPNQKVNNQQENAGNRKARPTSLANRDDESISSADNTANGKGSRTSVRKEEKERSDNYDKGRS